MGVRYREYKIQPKRVSSKYKQANLQFLYAFEHALYSLIVFYIRPIQMLCYLFFIKRASVLKECAGCFYCERNVNKCFSDFSLG